MPDRRTGVVGRRGRPRAATRLRTHTPREVPPPSPGTGRPRRRRASPARRARTPPSTPRSRARGACPTPRLASCAPPGVRAVCGRRRRTVASTRSAVRRPRAWACGWPGARSCVLRSGGIGASHRWKPERTRGVRPDGRWEDDSMIIEIRGHDLPGGSCGPTPEGGEYVNIHVGLARRNDTVDLVPGHAESASWELEVKVKDGPEGGFDCTGPSVFGTPGARHLGLRWVRVADDGSILVCFAPRSCA